MQQQIKKHTCIKHFSTIGLIINKMDFIVDAPINCSLKMGYNYVFDIFLYKTYFHIKKNIKPKYKKTKTLNICLCLCYVYVMS